MNCDNRQSVLQISIKLVIQNIKYIVFLLFRIDYMSKGLASYHIILLYSTQCPNFFETSLKSKLNLSQHLIFCLHILTWTLQVAFAGPGGTFNWNTWPTIAEESGMPACTPPFFAEQSGIGVGGPSPTEDAAACSSESTEDCIEGSSSTDIISTSVSCCSGTAPWAMVTRSTITRGIVLHERSLLHPASPQLMSLRLQCIAIGLWAAQQLYRGCTFLHRNNKLIGPSDDYGSVCVMDMQENPVKL